MVDEIRNSANSVYRDYSTNGVPSSGNHKPVKAQIRDLFDLVETEIEAVESLVTSGVHWKSPVRVATTVAGTLASSFENGDTIDSVVLATGNRILIKNQSAGAENGVYTVNASGAPTRATDVDNGTEMLNAAFLVEEGTTNELTQWICQTPGPITLGTTAIGFVMISDQKGAIYDEVEEARGDEASLDERLDKIDVAIAGAESADGSYAAFCIERSNREIELPKALIMILVGQSGNVSRGTAISTVVNSNAYMPIGGNAMAEFTHFPVNNEHSAIWEDVASVVVHSEGVGESPMSGIITTVMGGYFERFYGCSIAVGARVLDVQAVGGIRNNLYGVTQRLCNIARNDGYRPIVAFSIHHGEADMTAGNSEADYISDATAYYKMCQAVAAQGMEKPDYIAPIIVHNPIQMNGATDGAESMVIHTAITRMSKRSPNAIYAGGCYHFDSENDRVHQTPAGYRMRGEWNGHLLREYFEKGNRLHALEVVDVTWSGTTATVFFNEDVSLDTSYDWGTNLNAANAEYGFEWKDNNVNIAVTTVLVQGRKVILTLATTPVGTLAQQKLRVASQTTTGSLTNGANNRSGSQIRVNETGRSSIYQYGDARYGIHHRWAIPQLCNVRAA